MQLKVWLVRKTSVPFRNALKHPVYKSCMHLRKFIRSQRCSGASGLICHDVKTAKVVTGVRKKELGAWRENGEDSVKCRPQRREVRVENDEYERESSSA